MRSTTVEPVPIELLVAANRTRAVGAGIDPNQYEQVTGNLEHASEWTGAFLAIAEAYRTTAERAERSAHRASAGDAYLQAALWAHFASTWPNPDRDAHAGAVDTAASSYRAALAQLDGGARWIDRTAEPLPFKGVLRVPAGVSEPPLVLIISGLDSGKEEFDHVANALLARGVATFAFDGPGQAELSPTATIEIEYERVVAHVLDALAHEPTMTADLTRVGAIALSLGGHYGIRAAAAEPRIKALATVSGVARLPWPQLPPIVTETLVQRCGSDERAREFAATVDAASTARRINAPLLIVAGGEDPIPRPDEAAAVARSAPHAELLLIDDGDHLLANRQWLWLAQASDWLADRLSSTATAQGRVWCAR